MPSKTKRLGSIYWQLAAYFFGVILMTIAVIVIAVSTIPDRNRVPDKEMELESKVAFMARMVAEEYNRNGNMNRVRALINDLGRISNCYLKFMDCDGKIIYVSKKGFPGPLNMNLVHLSPEEMAEVKSTQRTSGEYVINADRFEVILSYSAALVGSMDKPQGVLLLVVPQGPPRPKKGSLNIVLIHGILCALLITTGAALLLSWSFIRPFRKMQIAAEKMSKGDFSTRMDLKRNDELGALAGSFDYMAEELKDNIENRLKLMGDISHELNTPIAAIRVNLEAFQDGMFDSEEEKEQALEAMVNQTKRISLFVDDILELSKFEAGAIKMHFEPFLAAEPVKRVVEAVKLIAADKNMQVKYEIENESLQAMGDGARILQVVQNLVNNAVYHNADGITVTIHLKQEGDRAVYTVSDNGVGIPPNELQNIFRRFHKVDKSRTRRQAGSGLGLAIVKEIVEAHNSRITVESTQGVGTQFSFSLPVAEG